MLRESFVCLFVVCLFVCLFVVCLFVCLLPESVVAVSVQLPEPLLEAGHLDKEICSVLYIYIIQCILYIYYIYKAA